MTNERITNKQKDFLRTLKIIEKKINEDIKTLKKEKNKQLKKILLKSNNKVKTELLFWILNVKNKRKAYETLRNMENKKLIKIKRSGHFFENIILTTKGKIVIS